MNKKDYRVKLKVGDAEVEVEGAESGVVKIVEALSEVLRSSRRPASLGIASIASAVAAPSPSPVRTGPADIRSFFEEKKPSSDIEAAATAAYYYQYVAAEPQRRETIDSASLQEAFRLARRRLPSRTIYTLTNARSAGYLDSAGEGEFRLNPVGYNLVEHGLGSSGDEEPKKNDRKNRKKRLRRQAKKKR